MTSFRLVAVTDLFKPTGGKSQFIRSYFETHPGSYPVYSASLAGPFGFVDTFDYDGEFLTWCMNGYAGAMEVINGRFSMTRDRGVLLPRDDVRVPDLTYVKYQLEPVLKEMAVGRRVDDRRNDYTKIYSGTVKDALVSLPIKEDGTFDYGHMSAVGERLRRVEDRQTKVERLLESVRSADVVISCPAPFRVVGLSDGDLFDLSIGTRVLLSEVGEEGIPVYSASVRKIFGHTTSSNLTDFTLDSLLWGIDWVFDWNRIPAGQTFANTDHCGRLCIKEPSIDSEYLLWALRSTRAEYGFDRVFRANLNNVKRSVEIAIPVDAAGRFNLTEQRRLASQHAHVDQLRQTAVRTLSEVAQVRLDVSAA